MHPNPEVQRGVDISSDPRKFYMYIQYIICCMKKTLYSLIPLGGPDWLYSAPVSWYDVLLLLRSGLLHYINKYSSEQVYDFKLSSEEMKKIFALNKDWRAFGLEW